MTFMEVMMEVSPIIVVLTICLILSTIGVEILERRKKK